MIDLAVATVMLQWSAGGMFFVWITTRHRMVSLGYGWLMRGTYASLAAVGLWTGLSYGEGILLREVASAGVVVSCLVGLAVSVARKDAGVSGARAEHDRRTARVAAMTGIERHVEERSDDSGPEFPPVLDLVPAVIGLIGVVAAAVDSGELVALPRFVVGALFLGAVSDAMLLGHWYLVQPGLERRPLLELVRWTMFLWPLEVLVFLLPVGMISVLNGSIDDGYNGLLGWFWVACAVATGILCAVTIAALRERYYSAVMAATGLLYLAILTAFGLDLVARATLA